MSTVIGEVGDFITIPSGLLRATSPRFGTSILDTNGNELIVLTATGSAVNEITFANAATGNPPTFTASGGDTDINIKLAPKGAGILESTGPLKLSGTGTTNFITPDAGSSVPTKIDIPFFAPAAFGQIIATGIPSSAPTTARVITVFDARTVSHQPSVAVLSPNEQHIFGDSWEGSNSDITLRLSSTGDIIFTNSGTTEIARFGTAGLTLPNSGNIVVGTGAGTKIATDTSQKLGFWNASPVVQQVLATGAGATVDNVISFLQTIGLCKQS